jgi:phosphoglycolate phosphatase
VPGARRREGSKKTLSDALIFDIDGTLWNACSSSAKGWNLALAKLGVPERVSAGQVESVSGKPFERCVDALLPGLRTRHPEFLDTLSGCEQAAVERDGGEFYEGAVETVTRLSHDFPVFLVSNCQEWYLRLFLDFSGLGPVLDGCDCHGQSGKPKSEMLTDIKRGKALSAPVYIGDTAADAAAARAAGMSHIHVSWGFGQPDAEAVVVDSFTELLACLRSATPG